MGLNKPIDYGLNTENVQVQTKLYGVRWWIAFFIALVAVLTRMLQGMFGVINNIMVCYFNISYFAVDWFTLATIPAMFFFSLFMALMIYNKVKVLKKLAVTMSVCLVVTGACHLFAYVYPPLFLLMYLGQITLGFAFAILDAVSASLALSWFPEHQVGFALAARSVGARLGALLGIIIPSNLFTSPFNFSTSTTTLNSSSHTYGTWFEINRIRFMLFASVVLFVCVIILVFFIIVYDEKPPIPPTNAQALIQTNQVTYGCANIFKDLKGFGSACAEIMLNKVFFRISLNLSVISGCLVLQKMLMGEIFRDFFVDIGYLNKANAMSGVVVALFEMGAVIGNTISGKLTDHFKNYDHQIQIGVLLSAIVVSGLSVAYHFRCVVTVCILVTLFGILVCSSNVQHFETIYQHFFPTETSFLAALLALSRSAGYLALSQACRFIQNKYKGSSVLITIAVLLFCSFLNSLFIKPAYRRLEANSLSTNAVNMNDRGSTEDEDELLIPATQ